MKKFLLLTLTLCLLLVFAACTNAAEEPTVTTEEPTVTTEESIVTTEESIVATEDCVHDWQPADCYNAKTCRLCAVTEGGPEHQYELTETVTATCTESGTELYFCNICDDPKQVEIPAEGHMVEDGVCTICAEQVQ